jgi:hypothetical protein
MGPVTFHAVYYDELLSQPADPFHNGRLPSDMEAHALWHYYVQACINLKKARENLVYENEQSLSFDVMAARRLLESISFIYGTTPSRMVRYWDAVEAQRRALGFTENADLPHAMRFRFN